MPTAIAAYAVLALFANNLGQVAAADVARSAVAALAMAPAVFLGLYGALRHADKAAVIAASALVFFFAYGHVHSLVQDLTVAGIRVGRHSLLLGAWLLLLGGLVVFVLRTRRSLTTVVRSLTVAALALFTIPSLAISGTWISSAADTGDSPSMPAVAAPSLRATEPLPDIY